MLLDTKRANEIFGVLKKNLLNDFYVLNVIKLLLKK